MTTDSKEFTEILQRVPRWHYLTPGVDVWQEGDEYYSKFEGWTQAVHMSTKLLCEMGTTISYPAVRRPIPETVRRSMCWWALYNKLATVAPLPRFDQALSRFIITMYDLEIDDVNLDVEEESEIGGLRGFNGSSEAYAAIPILGGEPEIIKNLQEGPGAYMRWVLSHP